MATADIHSGICGFITTVKALADEEDPRRVKLTITSNCTAVQRLASRLSEVDPFREFTFRGAGPQTLQCAAENLTHAACPVPSGIIKAVEVAAGLALPADVSIKIIRE